MGIVSRAELEEILGEVEKPVRYIGNEWNSIVRDGEGIDVRVALAYPDTYEIGMSHLGFRILYSLLNGKEGVAAERAFAPWPDMERALRRRGLPLHSLETKRALADFDLVGFSLQYEMTVTNVLLMLDLAGIPFLAADRTEGDPLVLAGGPVAMSPEPFADFFDLVAIGDGEELFPEVIDAYRELRDGGADRATVVAELGRLPGLYAPAHYRLETDPETGLQVVAGSDTHAFPVRRRILMDLSRHPFPREIIVPFCEIVHGRVAVEIMRGCNVGCRFCQAGYIYRPERVRTPHDVVSTALGSSATTGFDEVSLTSLNTGEYPDVETVLTRLMDRFEQSTTAVSLPSLRASSLRGGLLDELGRVRKSGLTIAPEGGTQRMRDVINKNITDEDITSAAEAAYGHGWDLIKLYFMIGQPTETEEDVLGIAETAKRVLAVGGRHRGGRARVNLGVSSFIPKPFTPFQWLPMERPESLRAKQQQILRTLGRCRVKFGRHDVATSVVESALSRADRRVARVILRAYRAGARFDGWTEHFDADRWERAFAEEGLSLSDYAHREFPVGGRLPWDHVDIGVRSSYLAKELERALAAEVVSICSGADCHGCGSFVKECLSGNASHGRDFPQRPARERPLRPAAPPQRQHRATFAKTGWPRFISHLDLLRTLRFAFRRAGVPLAYSEGFHPMPKMSFGPALPLGYEGLAELMDFTTLGAVDPDATVAALNASLPPGLRFTAAWELAADAPKLSKRLEAADYTVRLPLSDVTDVDVDGELDRLLGAESLRLVRHRKGLEKTVDVRPGLLAAAWDGETLRLRLRVVGQGNARPEEIVDLLVGRALPRCRVTRENLLRVGAEGTCTPVLAPEAAPVA